MNAENAHKLARRFIELPLEKRRLFLDGLRAEGVDFSLFPIPSDIVSDESDRLSYSQQRMWFLWQLDPQSPAYNLPMAVRLKGELDRSALQSAFDGLVARHETLRSHFSEQDGLARQHIAEPFAVTIDQHDLSTVETSEREEQVRSFADAEALAPFDLTSGPLLRVHLLKLAAQEHVLLLTLHHIVADGWSHNVLIDEFTRLYDSACSGIEATLHPLPIQYRDYALWQRSWLEAGEQARQLAYWSDKLGDDHSQLELPTDHPRPSAPSYRGARYEFQVEPALVERLRDLAREQGVTLFMVLLAAFKVLLQRYSGQQVIRVGVPVANRNRSEVEGLIGCFINTQVLHTEIDPLIDVVELLQRIKETALGAQAHQDLPFERLVEALDLDRSLSHNPLFQVLFNHQPNVVDAGQISTRSGLGLEKVLLDRHSARFDLSLDTYESAGRLHAVFTYALDVFDGDTVRTLQQHWLQLLEGLTVESKCVVGELPLLLAEHEAKVEQVETYAADRCIHHLIEQSAKTEPLHVAAVSGEQQVDYQTLNERANAVAQVLLDSGTQPDQRVGVIADRSIEMLVGILAVLKSGAAYLPLEPDQPRERLDFMLADSSVQLVLVSASWSGELPGGIVRIELDKAPRSTKTPMVNINPANLAYVIYTSGTTGLPKGVGISHAALVNYVQGMSCRLPMDDLHNLAMVTTPAADLGHTLFYGALCSGKTLHMLDKDSVLDAETFAAYMNHHRIDTLKIVPSHLQAMLAAGASALPTRCLIVGGESCSTGLLEHIASLAPELQVINHYGPTETTVGVLTHEVRGQPLLGRPLANIRAKVLSDCLQAVPGSARGELYISGAGLARGYLGCAALTAEHFVPDPIGAEGERMYRTGDWVRRNAKGELLFVGRMDGQVKIRGYRVELAEIESQLRQLPSISNAVVQVIGDDINRQVAAWLVPAVTLADEAGQKLFLDDIRRELKQRLPEHMQPTHMLALERLPVTANGKVDVKALPEPVANVVSYVAPVTQLQTQLAEVWGQVLRVERVGLTDNFFALGGHSLLATQVVSRARKQLDMDIPLRALFDTADLQSFAASVQGIGRFEESCIELLDRSTPLAVSHAQHRQWLFWKLNPQSTAYNTPLAVRMRGSLDRQALQAALDTLVARHESLRTVFEEQGGQPWQRILPVGSMPIGYEDLAGLEEEDVTRKLEEEVFATFDLETGPLIRVRLFKVGEDEHLLAVTLHHIVSDGWSMSVMVREFATTYNAWATGQVQQFQPLPVQYVDYATWQRERLADGQIQEQLSYWRTKLEGDFDVLELPADRVRPQVQSYKGGRVDIRLSDELTEKLRRLAVEANATLFHVFLATFAILLSRYSGRDKTNIGVPVTNRNRLELEGLIGFFVNTIVVRVDVEPVMGFRQLLEAVKETALEAQANKDIPFDVLVEELKPERGLGYNPLFQVMYNHLRDFGEQVSADSLYGLHVGEVNLLERSAQFDLSLDTMEGSDGVTAFFSYSSDLFDVRRIERLARHWLNLLYAVAERPWQAISELPLLDQEEREQIIYEWNCTEASYPREQCIHQLIEAQAEKTPDAVAVMFGDQELTYRELNRRANQLAHKLRELGVAPDVLVGIAVERSLEMVIGLLAILKAGGAYVPLDPEYPQERLTYMMEDSQALLLLSQSSLLERLPQAVQANVLLLDNFSLESYSFENPEILLTPGNLAYSIYTSGSTGRPKGVLIEHRNVAALIGWAHSVYSQEDLQGVLASTSICFDLSVWELFVTLSAGGYIVLANNALELPQLAAKERVRLVNTVPSAIKVLSESGQIPESVRIINLAGEALKQSLVDSLYQAKHIEKVYDLYGPSEDTTYSTYTLRALNGQANIGAPISNGSAYLLSSSMNPLPVGCSGEIYLAGAGLVRGYLGRPALSAEKFLPNPFDSSEQGGGRLYRTGDLAKYCADGVIEYAGRIDHQVKIRGFRIELGEIEARLQGHEAVREAVVIDIEGPSGKQLVAYLVPSADQMADAEQQGELRTSLRDYLKEVLPDYMVPAHLLFLDKLPLTPNGKLDRKALPNPEVNQLQQEYVAPQSEFEQRIADIWADVLKVERVGLTDNFFNLGGHSLLAVQVIYQINAKLDIDSPLQLIFERPVLSDFSMSLESCSLALSEAGLSDIEKLMNEMAEA
ncbi:amino acid adenylation domain-containing protein [Pseudomonas sp. ABC1]|uniref:non-ribosomal peptide synthetase n=1 Tax=Pseudomonas sp. ABC1 TaxID=2748080 RepID=UPI0015C3A350|nr:non-ribosomal peptide synthetase [Pseudomonas sp. ABC1]QLF91732.1 amino acid adenylation domain-containing protein [Pseudomonas sp. ABC1]